MKTPRDEAMETARVGSKGQITIPKKVREKMGIQPGDEVGFEEKDGLLVITKVIARSPLDGWIGKLEHLKGQRSDDLVKETRG